MHIAKTTFSGSPNIGLHGYVTDTYALLGEHLVGKRKKEVEDVLQVPLHTITIAGTDMPGVFMAGNANAVLVPGITFENELTALQQLNIPYKVFETKHTCLGNNIVCNEHGAIISTDFSEQERVQIETLLGVPVVQLDVAGLKTPGACIVVHGDRGIVHRDIGPEKEQIEATLKVTLTPATANLGTPYLHAALLHNKHGFLIGESSGGPEIVHIDEVLYG